MEDRLILITGTTSGLGLETAKKLVAMGFRVVLASRNIHVAKIQANEMQSETGNNSIDVMEIDLASFESIEKFVGEFYKKYDKLDILINNAGVFCDTEKKTIEGFEMTMGVNFIGTYYLTKLLLPIIKKGKNQRIVNVASKAGYYGKLNIKKDFFKNHAHGFKAYSASKLAILMMTIYFSEKLTNDGISVNSVHPGDVATGIWKGESLLMKLIAPINKRRYMSPEKACKTIVYVATSNEILGVTGKLFEKTNKAMEYNKKIQDKDVINKLFNYTDNLISTINNDIKN